MNHNSDYEYNTWFEQEEGYSFLVNESALANITQLEDGKWRWQLLFNYFHLQTNDWQGICNSKEDAQRIVEEKLNLK